MRVKTTNGAVAGCLLAAEVTTDHPASRDGIPVLLVEGTPVGILDAAEAGYQIIEITAEESASLELAGYAIPMGVAESADTPG